MKTDNALAPIVLHQPFDAHMHGRQDTLLETVLPYTMRQFSGSLFMPNTNPTIIRLTDLLRYRWSVSNVMKDHGLDTSSGFLPIFTFYLSEELYMHDVAFAWEKRLFHGIKYYPKGGTTNSAKGLIGFRKTFDTLEQMQKLGIPLLIHGETPIWKGEVVDDYEREEMFIETELIQLMKEFPQLNIVLEHITTTAAAQFTLSHENVKATITPQHCLLDRRGLFNGISFDGRQPRFDLAKNGSNPSLMCRPILKHQRELTGIQDALKKQAREGLRKFGLGTDSAPHTADKKYCECGACGVYSAPIALQLYAMAFEQMEILDHLPAFACDVMPDFYKIKDLLPKKTVTLVPVSQTVQKDYDGIVPPFAGADITWSIQAE